MEQPAGDDVGAPDPHGDAALREMGLAEVIEAALALYRANWRVLMAIVALFVVPLEALTQVLSRSEGAVATVLAIVVALAVGPLMGGAVSRAAGELLLGRQPDAAGAVNFTLARIAPLFAVSIMTVAAVALGFVLLVVPGVLLLVRLYFGAVVVVLEGSGPVDALRRSFDLTRGHFWRLLGAALVIGIVAVVVATVLQLPFLFASGMGEDVVVATIGAALVQVLVAPFSALAVVLLYVDLRVRSEGLDLAALAAQLPPDDEVTRPAAD